MSGGRYTAFCLPCMVMRLPLTNVPSVDVSCSCTPGHGRLCRGPVRLQGARSRMQNVTHCIFTRQIGRGRGTYSSHLQQQLTACVSTKQQTHLPVSFGAGHRLRVRSKIGLGSGLSYGSGLGHGTLGCSFFAQTGRNPGHSVAALSNAWVARTCVFASARVLRVFSRTVRAAFCLCSIDWAMDPSIGPASALRTGTELLGAEHDFFGGRGGNWRIEGFGLAKSELAKSKR